MNEGDAQVETDRTRLVLMSAQFIDLILSGKRAEAERALGATVPDDWPDDDDRWLLRLRREQISADESSAPWLVRAVVDRKNARMLGHIGFHGPPDDRGTVEIGYTIFADHRRRGFAEEAVRALIEWAHEHAGVTRFRASVAPHNEPSLRLIDKLGFFQTGVQWDERDGEELVFEVNYPLRAPPARA